MHLDPPHGNILVFVDDAEAGQQLGRYVAATGERPLILSGDEGFRTRDDEDVDLVITDLDPEHAAARILLDRLLSGAMLPRVPRIHLFRNESFRKEIAERGLDSAALSLPAPPDAQELQVRVRVAAEVGRLRREVARTTITDPLTGLCNRRFLLRRLEEEFARARRYRAPLSLVLLDIEQLKRINDTFGQTTGDSVILQFAQIVRVQVRKEDVLGRLGGATFAVVLPGNGCRGAATFAGKVRTEAEEIVLQHGADLVSVHVSAGISTYPDSSTVRNADTLIRAAENALSEAKTRGGNRVFIDEGVLSHERRVVLVVDPDPELLDLAEDLLALDDYKVVRADSARSALETLRFRLPDLLVIDLHMAEHPGGAPLIEQIHTLFPTADFPIIGLSRDSGTSPDRLVRLGVDRFITKPFSVSLLRGAARDLLEAPRTA